MSSLANRGFGTNDKKHHVTDKFYDAPFEIIISNASSTNNAILTCRCYPVCRKETLFLKINQGGVGDDIFNLFLSSSISLKYLDSIIDHIRKNPNVTHKIFCKHMGKIDLFLIKKLFFTLVAASVLEAAFDVENEKGSHSFQT